MGELLPAGGLGAALALLAGVIGYLLNANRADRKEYQEAIDRAEARADAAETRTRAAEQRSDALQQAVDEARARRRAAEDRAAELARQLADTHRGRDVGR